MLRFKLKFLVLLGLALARPAAAQAADEWPHVTYRRATAAFEQQRWNEARTLFLELWSRSKTYDVASGLGLVEYQLSNYAGAAKYYAHAVAMVPPMERPETVQTFRRILSELKGVVGTARVAVNRSGAEVIVDGALVGRSPLESEIFLSAGRHTIEVRLGEQLETRAVDVLPGSFHTIDFELPEPPEAEDPPRAVPLSSAEHDRGIQTSSVSWLPVVAGSALTLVSAGVGIGFHAAAESDRKDLDRVVDSIGSRACARSVVPAECSEVSTLVDTYERNRALSNASFAVAGVAAASTAIYFFVARPDRTAAARELSIHATASDSSASFALAGTF